MEDDTLIASLRSAVDKIKTLYEHLFTSSDKNCFHEGRAIEAVAGGADFGSSFIN
jgi:hypothetical protein